MNSDKPWVIIFNWQDPLGRLFISEEDHAVVLKAVSKGLEQLVIGGQIIPLRYALVRENPDYIDQNKVAKLREIIEKKKEETRKKYG